MQHLQLNQVIMICSWYARIYLVPDICQILIKMCYDKNGWELKSTKHQHTLITEDRKSIIFTDSGWIRNTQTIQSGKIFNLLLEFFILSPRRHAHTMCVGLEVSKPHKSTAYISHINCSPSFNKKGILIEKTNQNMTKLEELNLDSDILVYIGEKNILFYSYCYSIQIEVDMIGGIFNVNGKMKKIDKNNEYKFLFYNYNGIVSILQMKKTTLLLLE